MMGLEEVQNNLSLQVTTFILALTGEKTDDGLGVWLVLIPTLVTILIGVWTINSTLRRNLLDKNITRERMKWRQEVREIVQRVNMLFTISYVPINWKSRAELKGLCAKLETRLNPVSFYDFKLINSLKNLIKLREGKDTKNENYEKALDEFNYQVSILLKHDWERSKRESMGFLDRSAYYFKVEKLSKAVPIPEVAKQGEEGKNKEAMVLEAMEQREEELNEKIILQDIKLGSKTGVYKRFRYTVSFIFILFIILIPTRFFFKIAPLDMFIYFGISLGALLLIYLFIPLVGGGKVEKIKVKKIKNDCYEKGSASKGLVFYLWLLISLIIVIFINVLLLSAIDKFFKSPLYDWMSDMEGIDFLFKILSIIVLLIIAILFASLTSKFHWLDRYRPVVLQAVIIIIGMHAVTSYDTNFADKSFSQIALTMAGYAVVGMLILSGVEIMKNMENKNL